MSRRYRTPARGLGLAVLCASLGGVTASAAVAQSSSPPPAPPPVLNLDGLGVRRNTTPRPIQRPVVNAWPRLDPGAIFCPTASDLERHFAVLAARREGNPNPPAEPTGCRIVRVPTAITIVQRPSPGHVEVKLSDPPNQTGWTDAWLPDKDPVAATRRPANAPGL